MPNRNPNVWHGGTEVQALLTHSHSCCQPDLTPLEHWAVSTESLWRRKMQIVTCFQLLGMCLADHTILGHVRFELIRQFVECNAPFPEDDGSPTLKKVRCVSAWYVRLSRPMGLNTVMHCGRP